MLEIPTLDVPTEITVFIDNQCRACRREVAFLRWLDRRDRLEFVDISHPDFEPPTPNHDFETLMAEIHARTPDGQWLTGVEVFRRLYSAAGLRLLVFPTRLPGISHLLDWGYRIFARNRVKWFGRCTVECHLPRGSAGDVSTLAGDSTGALEGAS